MSEWKRALIRRGGGLLTKSKENLSKSLFLCNKRALENGGLPLPPSAPGSAASVPELDYNVQYLSNIEIKHEWTLFRTI